VQAVYKDFPSGEPRIIRSTVVTIGPGLRSASLTLMIPELGELRTRGATDRTAEELSIAQVLK